MEMNSKSRSSHEQFLPGRDYPARPEFTGKQHKLADKALDTSCKENRQHCLESKEIRGFENYPPSHTLLDHMGFEAVFTPLSQLPSRRDPGLRRHVICRNPIKQLLPFSVEYTAVIVQIHAPGYSGTRQTREQRPAPDTMARHFDQERKHLP